MKSWRRVRASEDANADHGESVPQANLAHRALVPEYRDGVAIVLEHNLNGRRHRVVEMHRRLQGQFPGNGKHNFSDTVEGLGLHDQKRLQAKCHSDSVFPRGLRLFAAAVDFRTQRMPVAPGLQPWCPSTGDKRRPICILPVFGDVPGGQESPLLKRTDHG